MPHIPYIDEHLARVQQCREVLTLVQDDPALQELLIRSLEAMRDARPRASALIPLIHANASDMQDGQGTLIHVIPRRRHGALKIAVYEEMLKAGGEVTTDTLVDSMTKAGFQFVSAKPSVSVNEALRTLREEGRARIVRAEGIRNIWEVVKKEDKE